MVESSGAVTTCQGAKSRVEIENLGKVVDSGEGTANSGVGSYLV